MDTEKNNSSLQIKSRESGIELYRILLTLGVVIIHSSWTTQTYRMLEWSVCGFIFISGFYGVRYRLSKVFLLFVTAYISAGISYLIFTPLTGGNIHLFSALKYAAYNGGDYWFVGCYAVLLLVSPILNEILEKHCDIKQWKWWIPLLILGLWSWAIDWRFHRVFELILPQYDYGFGRTLGLGAFSPVTLILCYIGARFCNKYQDHKIFSKKWLLFTAMLILIPLVSLSFFFSRYSSPFAFAVAACGFFLFKGIRLPAWISRILFFIAPSSLGVYLIHCTSLGFDFIRATKTELTTVMHFSKWQSHLLIVLMIFSMCFCADLIRRFLFYFISVCYKKIKAYKMTHE
ncbi:MAG: hypothetical protein E7040_00140 [Lentisphaerae bacterium]|nr:hypothetical protein [Lentisphaerota bacterium]